MHGRAPARSNGAVVEYRDDDLQNSHFLRVDLSGSRMHGVIMQNVKITDAWLNNVEISGLLGSLTVNEVDVSGYVREELERRHPELHMLRAQDPDGLRDAWQMIERRADATLARARMLPEEKLHESVDGEWSYVETLRHLVFATDRWITGPVLNQSEPFHRLGMPNDDPERWRGTSIDVDARPTLDEALAVRRQRMASVAALISESSEQDLARTVPNPNGGTTWVGACIGVVLGEEWAHDRYANRDLDALGAPASDR
jgi:DinB superfamily